jgi:hypothetical protein
MPGLLHGHLLLVVEVAEEALERARLSSSSASSLML